MTERNFVHNIMMVLLQIQERKTTQTLELSDGMLALQSLDGNERAFGVPTFLPRRNPAKGPALSWTELSGSGKPVG